MKRVSRRHLQQPNFNGFEQFHQFFKILQQEHDTKYSNQSFENPDGMKRWAGQTQMPVWRWFNQITIILQEASAHKS